MNGKQIRNEILSTTAGIAGVTVASVLNFPFILIGLSGLGLYVGTRLLLPVHGGLVVTDALPDDLAKYVEEVTLSLNAISKEAKKLDEWKVKQNTDTIVNLGNSVLKILTEDNDGHGYISEVHRLITQFNTLLIKYILLSKHTIEDQTLKQAQSDFLALTEKVISSLQHYYRRGLKSDIQGFDVDMKVLESKIDNLTSKTP